MGEVYRARDTKLGRDVAIKAMSGTLRNDAARLARFEREAKVLASLNHPNIASIYGLEMVGQTPYLVLELVDGETLLTRLARGALALRDAVDIGRQIASAMEVAHDRGVVHRDLKPGNIMLTPSGLVKVLDFGLAKEPDAAAAGCDLSMSPTMPLSATRDGVILGTAPYMSPEQARGLAVDRRTDVWAFGCVLYECLSGRRTFEGDTTSDVIARILEREPDWSGLPSTTPARLRDILRRSLTKNPDERPRDIGDVGRELSTIALEMSAGTGSASKRARDLQSLAVLYFENLSNDADSDYFCAGITEDILTDLSKIKGLRVASRNAVARYRGSPAEISAIAAELGVLAVLEGSVRRAGDRVRISAQLINGADGFHLWAERYDRTLQDVFAVQEEIASSIAEALRVTITRDESEDLVSDRPVDVQAYDLYLKGRQRYASYSPESLRDAIDLFRQAIGIDPGYALAWAGIADCYGQMMQRESVVDVAEVTRLGLEAASRAKAFNPRLPEAYKAEAVVLRFAGDLDGSRAALLAALEINPRFTPALINLAIDFFGRADLAGTERLARRAADVDPQNPFAKTWVAIVLVLTDRLDEATTMEAHLRAISAGTFYRKTVQALYVWIHLRRGNPDAAQRLIDAGDAEWGAPAAMHACESLIAVRAGRLDEARLIVRELEDTPGIDARALMLLAIAALELGEPDRALRLLSRRVIAGSSGTFVRLEPWLRPLANREPYAPRRSDATLVWPLEAPMLSAECHALFREVRIESGRPEGSDAAWSRERAV